MNTPSANPILRRDGHHHGVGLRALRYLSFALVVACGPAATPAPAATTVAPAATEEAACGDANWQPPAGSLTVPGTGLAVLPPAAFERATSFDGFQGGADGRSSVMVVLLPNAPLEEAVRGFRTDFEGERPFSVQSFEPAVVGGQCGYLAAMEQDVPGVGTFQKWAAFVQTPRGVAMAMGTWPATDFDMSDPLRAAVLTLHESATPTDPFEGLDYRVDTVAPFVRPRRMGRGVGFIAGDAEISQPGEPLVIVVDSHSPMDVTDQCGALMRSQASMSEVTVDDVTTVTINGLTGCRALGHGTHVRGVELGLFEVVLQLGDGRYLRMVGRIDRARMEQFIPVFDRIAATLRLVR